MFSLRPNCNSHIKTLLWCALKPKIANAHLKFLGFFGRGRTAWLLADDVDGHGDDGGNNDDDDDGRDDDGDDNDDDDDDDIGNDGGFMSVVAVTVMLLVVIGMME